MKFNFVFFSLLYALFLLNSQIILAKSSAQATSGATHTSQSSLTSGSSSRSKKSPLSSKEKQIIDDFIQKAHDIPEKTKDNREQYLEKVDIAFKAYQKMWKYENEVSETGMNISESLNKKIKAAAKILFNSRNIQNMVWKLRSHKHSAQ